MHGDHEPRSRHHPRRTESRRAVAHPGDRSIALIGSDLHPLGFGAAIDDLDGNCVIAREKSRALRGRLHVTSQQRMASLNAGQASAKRARSRRPTQAAMATTFIGAV